MGNSALVRMRPPLRLRTVAKEAWRRGRSGRGVVNPGSRACALPESFGGFIFLPAGFLVQLRMSRCPAVAFREAAARCTESRSRTFLHSFFTLGTEKLSELFAFKYFPGLEPAEPR